MADLLGRARYTRPGQVQAAASSVFVLLVLLALLLGGLGFAVRWLCILAVICAGLRVAGFAFRAGENSRWFHW